MKRYFILSMVFLSLIALSACGGDGGENGGISMGQSGQPSPDGGATASAIASHEAAFGNTAPVSGMGRGTSRRFDEDGNLIGIYEVVEAPSKGSK